MYKKHQVVMLPLESNSGNFHSTPFWRNSDTNTLHHYGEIYKTGDDCSPCHLYILSDEEIKEGEIGWIDWEGKGRTEDLRIGKVIGITKEQIEIRNQYGNISETSNNFPNAKWGKVIAATDKSLGLPKPSEGFIKAFIEAYNSGNPITEIDVEYLQYNYPHQPYNFVDHEEIKVNPKDNTITIKKIWVYKNL